MDREGVRRQFENEGYVKLTGLLDALVVSQARAAMEELVEYHAQSLVAAGKLASTLAEEPFETRFFRLYENHLDDAPKSFRRELHLTGLFDLFFSPILLDVVEELIGPEIRLYPNYSARPKFPEWKGTEVLWHQDGGYTEQIGGPAGSVEAQRMVNVWTPLVPARALNGCMQFVPGTHKLGSVPHESREYYLEIAQESLDPHVKKAIDIELDPGDVVLFQNLLFHRGQPNLSSEIRWSFDWRYQDAGQPTLRKEEGHIARSRNNPQQAVQSATEWGSLSFR
jgi:ectoine hydroxylase-related dioxygenase (phytanoyl-CoA dioxygenase family)